MPKEPLYPHVPKKREPLFPHTTRGQASSLPKSERVGDYRKTFDLAPGDRVKITIPVASGSFPAGWAEGSVISAKFYGEREGWYIELNKDKVSPGWQSGYGYWKQGVDGGIVEKIPHVPKSRQPAEKLPATKREGRFVIKMDRMGNIILTHTERPGDVFLQFEADKEVIYDILKKSEKKDLDAGWNVEIKDTEPRASILQELWESSSNIELLASTEGDPIRKFCCRQCGECAPKELLEEGLFLDRISWLRSHYKDKHPGMWGKGSAASGYDKELEQLRRDLHDKAISEEAYKKAAQEILERKYHAKTSLPQTVEDFEPVSPQYRHLVGLVSEPLPKEAE